MINENIIGFAGRCYSGKSELSKLCTNYGYEIKSFGYPLKQLIADLINGTIEDVNRLKKININLKLNEEKLIYISKRTNIPLDVIKNKIGNKIFKNTREMLQFIGTDLIREYNINWHVNEIKKTLEKNKKYVFDDVRFENEKNMIEELNGTCWFIVRPNLKDVSNHISETSLKWQDFSNVIVNNESLEYLKFNWNIFMENGYKNSLEKRQKLIFDITCNNSMIDELVEHSKNKFNLLDALFITKYEFIYKATYLNNNNIKSIEQCDNFVKVLLNDDVADIVTNPLIIEDLKMYV